MKILYGDTDVTELLYSYTRKHTFTNLIGNAASQQLDISLDNDSGVFTSEGLSNNVFTIQQTDDSNNLFFKAYEMPESWTGEISITLYDVLYALDKLYESTLSYTSPVAISAQIEEIERITGIEIDTSNMDEEVLEKTVGTYDSSKSCREYLMMYAELSSGSFYPSSEKYGKITFQKFSKEVAHTYEDLYNYTKGAEFKASKVTFKDSLVTYQKGDDTGNTYYLESTNDYITRQADVDRIYETLNGLDVNSASSIESDFITNIQPGEVIEVKDAFNFVCLTITETYTGGETPAIKLAGELTSTNQEQNNTVTSSTKLKVLKAETDSNSEAIKIRAEEIKELNDQLTLISLQLGQIDLKVQNLMTGTEWKQGEKIQKYETTYDPGTDLRLYPTYEFFTWSVCSDKLTVADTLIMGTNDYASHVKEICYNTEDNKYYMFLLNTSGEYYWKELSDEEVIEITPRYTLLQLTKEAIKATAYLTDATGEKISTLTIEPEKITATNLMCC